MQKRRTANTMEMEMDNTDVTANINNNADNYESNKTWMNKRNMMITYP
jgi:hypothetical protein